MSKAVWFFLLLWVASPAYSKGPPSERSPLLDQEGTSKCESLDRFYKRTLQRNGTKLQVAENVGLLTANTAGCFYMMALGGDLAKKWIPKALAYTACPLFGIPLILISQHSSQDTLEAARKLTDADWGNITPPNELTWSSAGRGTVIIGAIATGATLSSIGVCYNYIYLHEFLGQAGSAPFVIAAAVVGTNACTISVLHFLDGVKVDALKVFASTRKCLSRFCGKETPSDSPIETKRTQLKNRVSRWITSLENEDPNRIDSIYGAILEKGLSSQIFAKEPDCGLEDANADAPSRCLNCTKTSFGWAGSALGLAGAISVFAATEFSIQYILEGCGLGTESAEMVSQVGGALGVGALACMRGYFTRSASERAVELTASGGDGAVKELSSWAVSVVSVLPRMELVLKTTSGGWMRNGLLACNVISSVCTDYCGWRTAPEGARGVLGCKSLQEQLIPSLKQLKNDIDFFSDETVEEIFQMSQIPEPHVAEL